MQRIVDRARERDHFHATLERLESWKGLTDTTRTSALYSAIAQYHTDLDSEQARLSESQVHHVLPADPDEAVRTMQELESFRTDWTEVELDTLEEFIKVAVCPSPPASSITPIQRAFFGDEGDWMWKWILYTMSPDRLVELLQYVYAHLPPTVAGELMFRDGSVVVRLLAPPETFLKILVATREWLAPYLASRPILVAEVLVYAAEHGLSIRFVQGVWNLGLPRLMDVLRALGNQLSMWWLYSLGLTTHRGYFLPGLIWHLLQDPVVVEWLSTPDGPMPKTNPLWSMLPVAEAPKLMALMIAIKDLNLLVVRNVKRIANQGIDATLKVILGEFQPSRAGIVDVPLCTDVTYDSSSYCLRAAPRSVFWKAFVDIQDMDRLWRLLVEYRYDVNLVPVEYRTGYTQALAVQSTELDKKVDVYVEEWSDAANVPYSDEYTWPEPADEPRPASEVYLMEEGKTDAVRRGPLSHVGGSSSKKKASVALSHTAKFNLVKNRGFKGKEHNGSSGKRIPKPSSVKDPARRKKVIKQILAIAYSEARHHPTKK